MKAGLKERIEAVGYWRINIRPHGEVTFRPRLPDIEQRVTRASVNLRGWDFPSIINRDDESFGREREPEFVGHWCDWGHHVEFWRCYRSTQFIAYRALWEDFEPAGGERPRPEGKLLSVQGALWSLIEFYEFAHRLLVEGFYESGAKVSIELHNSSRRRLWISQWNRMPFSYPRQTTAQIVSLSRTFTPIELTENYRTLMREQIVEFFECFGWTPDLVQLERDQDRFYRREFD